MNGMKLLGFQISIAQPPPRSSSQYLYCHVDLHRPSHGDIYIFVAKGGKKLSHWCFSSDHKVLAWHLINVKLLWLPRALLQSLLLVSSYLRLSNCII